MPDLGGLPGVAAVAAPEEQELEATYFDTADLTLAKAGISLRRRTGGATPGWHLKLPMKQGRSRGSRVALGEATKSVPKSRGACFLVRDSALTSRSSG